MTEPGNAGLQPGSEEGQAPSKRAISELPETTRGWHSRNYLPHRDEIGLSQSITFRLADSLPQEKLRQLETSLTVVSADTREAERRKRIETWLDSGMGCCALRHPKLAEKVETALLHFDGERYRLLAWCIMPNHVHVLIRPTEPLSEIVQSWKSFTGRWALAHNAELELGVPGKILWMREYWDRFIRDETHLRQATAYIHNNPVSANLCLTPSHWLWSSARHSSDAGNVELQLNSCSQLAKPKTR